MIVLSLLAPLTALNASGFLFLRSTASATIALNFSGLRMGSTNVSPPVASPANSLNCTLLVPACNSLTACAVSSPACLAKSPSSFLTPSTVIEIVLPVRASNSLINVCDISTLSAAILALAAFFSAAFSSSASLALAALLPPASDFSNFLAATVVALTSCVARALGVKANPRDINPIGIAGSISENSRNPPTLSATFSASSRGDLALL